MKTRYKWINVPNLSPAVFQKLEGRALASNYDESVGVGFLLEMANKLFLKGRYVERISLTDVVELPNGEQSEYQRVEYRQTTFELKQKNKRLMLINPPRSTSAFCNALAKCSDYQISLDPVQIDVNRWLNNLEEKLGTALVERIYISDLIVSKETVAKVEIKGTNDVRGQVKKIVGNKKHSIVRIAAVFDELKIELLDTGQALLHSENNKHFSDYIEQSIPKTTANA